MSNTLTAQFAPSASMRITDPAVYAAIAAQYGFGTNIIFGVSPQTLATTYGIPLVNNPTTTDYGNLPAVFTLTSQSVVLGTPISTSADGVQTLGGQSYTDPNGRLFTSVTWEWQVEVSFFSIASQDVFSQQVVTWTGDASAGRLIPTTIDLSQGVTAILIFSDAAAPVWATSAMLTAGKHATYCVDPASTTLGVMSMTASGFTVTGGAGVSVNAAGFHYQAIVWNDTNGTKMSVGTYLGGGALGQPIATGLAGQTTMLFLTGGSVAGNPDGFYCETDHGTIVINIADNEALPLTGELSEVGVGRFATAATATRTDTIGHTYYFIAFAIPSSDPIRTTMFNSWTIVGTAGADIVTGLTFTPSFAFGRTYQFPVFAASWRGPTDAGTASHSTSIGGAQASGRLEAFGVGTITLGANLSPDTITTYGFALAGGSPTASSYPTPTWTFTDDLDLGDGTISGIETSQSSETSPGDGWHDAGQGTPQWWCNAALGLSVYQIDSPGTGWAACSGPASLNGWYLSTIGFGGQSTIVSAGRPANPRTWGNISTWTLTGNMAPYGGSPGAACSINNRMVYAAAGYTVGTDYPPIRIFDGRSDKELCRLPPTTANVVPNAVMSLLAANGTVYLTTWDTGTTSANWNGRVFQLDPETGVLTVLGTVFANGELPYALAWHMGRLWCGTNNAIGTVGKIYYFRPGIDSAWTLDHATATDTAGGVTSMASYGGKLYVGTDNAAAARGKVLVRDTAGAYTTSQTGSGGTARVNNGYLALTVLGANLYASYWNNDTTAISKIEKFTGSAWSTAYTGVGNTLRPFIVLQLDNGELYAVGGGLPLTAALLVTANGTSWTDLTAELPETTTTLLPMFGAVVT